VSCITWPVQYLSGLLACVFMDATEISLVNWKGLWINLHFVGTYDTGILIVRKNATHKESSQEKSHVHRTKFNGRPKLPGWTGKRWHSLESGHSGFYRRGRVRKLAHAQ
jgi:hypothetical protein